MSLIYLASPYTVLNADKMTGWQIEAAKSQRFIDVCKAAAAVMDWGLEVFCPIAHSHPIEVHGMTTIRDGDFWLKQDYAILKHCDEVFVLQLEGWDKSYGVMQEVDYAFTNGIPVSYIRPITDGYHFSPNPIDERRAEVAPA